MDGEARPVAGWGRTSPTFARIRTVRDADDVAEALAWAGPRGALPRGLGRSYGDVAQNAGGLVLDTTGLAGIQELDLERGTVRVGAGTSLDRLLRELVPLGWLVPVLPGTRNVTVGGAIANDVHGKNHHRDGGFCDHVVDLTLVTTDGERRTVTPAGDPELFAATAGGLGLTGVVTAATLHLLPIRTGFVRVDTDRANDLDDLMARMEEGDHRYRYSVAWIDCLARGRHLGRGVLTRADHAVTHELDRRHAGGDPLAFAPRTVGAVPPTPRLVGRTTVAAFNEAWFRRAPREARDRIRPLASFFFPLDGVAGWNRLYGRRGLVQYQFAVPFGRERTIASAIDRLSSRGCPSFLAVLKRFGPGRGLLSFPIPGWTLALDMPAAYPGLRRVLDELDLLVAQAGGRVYLAKDSRLRPELLRDMYPELDRWREVRGRVDPARVLRSDLERRLALGTDERREASV
ncbi:MAG TPA: FAD-binding oxidoreductase [Actinomycetota bacterium]